MSYKKKKKKEKPFTQGYDDILMGMDIIKNRILYPDGKPKKKDNTYKVLIFSLISFVIIFGIMMFMILR